MNVKLHHPKDLKRLRDRSRKERNAKQRDRYRAVLLALEGQTTEAIMHTLDRSKNFVQRWVYAPNQRLHLVPLLLTGNIGVFHLMKKGDLGHSYRFETAVVLFTKAVQFMNFPKSLSAIFIGSKVALCALDKHKLI